MGSRQPDSADPFGTAELNDATLTGWRTSSTRLAEDAAAEAELLEIGYRDRLFTELAANAADAAGTAGIVGRVCIWADGADVHVANTGAPLTVAGVQSLTALRVSPKHPDAEATTVGRFGMGFRATSLASRVVIASRSGSIVFDRQRTAAAVADFAPDVDVERLPAQRLAWPSDVEVSAGFDTEIILTVADPEAAAALVAESVDQAPDLLLELESIDEIDAGGTVFRRLDEGESVRITRDGHDHRAWLVARSSGTRWLVPLHGGRVVGLERDVLRSPTATDIELTLPARVITNLPLTPDRRDLHPGTDVAPAAAGYPELVALVPDDQKQAVIPPPALAAGRVDGALRHAVRAELTRARWVPSTTGEALAPERTWVFPGLTADLADLLGEVLEPLAHPDVSDRVTASLLVGLGARQLGLADLAELLSGVGGEDPTWWARLYAALSGSVVDSRDTEELGALPVPRADGRMHVGCRGLFLVDGLDAIDDPPVLTWVPTVAPAAYDPLLERLGLTRITPAQALDDPSLAAELDGDNPHGNLADVVLRLLSLPDAGPAPAALGSLELLGDDGELWPADELLLPDSPLVEVLVEDSPFGTVAASVVEKYDRRALLRLGVGWGFSVVHDPGPVAPDHDLPDEGQWWDSHEVPPEEVHAVRDLDLVDPDRWSRALSLLATDEATAPLLLGGYTRWWLRRYAEIDGTPLRHLRSVDNSAMRGLFDAIDVPDAAAGLLVGDLPDDADDASDWLSALADPDRAVEPGVAIRAHTALVAGLTDGRYRVADVEPPTGARTLAGTVAGDAVVVPEPWWVAVVPHTRAVLPGLPPLPEAAAHLAELLDVPIASEAYQALLDLAGEAVDPDSAEAVVLLAASGMVGPRQVVLHDDLLVRITDGDSDMEDADDGSADQDRVSSHRVPIWVDDTGTVHLARSRP
ncbi:sacsin N-terminal ATP-binding-like domain-containing protein [Gordonia sp. (in: high G+C Gram-positive bacteria)]|uniref:sacsin N-terminal ATP-binding-like domain-containing protein n=1 Tax=Gordonia sp. (in: high G+C Gram-positive bacteria) TaxID=84139 RepID=UPI003C7547A9